MERHPKDPAALVAGDLVVHAALEEGLRARLPVHGGTGAGGGGALAAVAKKIGESTDDDEKLPTAIKTVRAAPGPKRDEAIARMSEKFGFLQGPGAAHMDVGNKVNDASDPGAGPAKFKEYGHNAGGAKVINLLKDIKASRGGDAREAGSRLEQSLQLSALRSDSGDRKSVV